MVNEHNRRVQELVSQSYLYYGVNQPEGVVITEARYYEHCFYGYGEISGDKYGISFDAVDLNNDTFFSLTKVTVE